MTSRANEPAYPHDVTANYYGRGLGADTDVTKHQGLTVREEFAKAAMQGMLANNILGPYAAKVGREQFCREIADDALLHADTLIAALSKVKP